MLKTKLAFLGLSLAAVLSGCADAPIPAQPSFATDVRPILVARCVRCHGAGGKLNGDPLWDKGNPPSLAYLEHYDDVGPCGPMDPPAGCQKGARSVAPLIPGFITDPKMRMPPPPASPLDDWQIEVISRWAKMPKP